MKPKFDVVFVCLLCFLVDQSCCTENEDSIEIQNETSSSSPISSSFYTAAVVEFNSPGDKFSEPREIVDANLAEILKLIEEASEKGVDIIVFSEASLNYNGINSRENLSQVAVDLQATEVPDISECDYSHDSILGELSFAAANASIYVLVNVVEVETCNESEACPPDGLKLFNTNLVFDRRGCIVSRYRKFNLFVEPNMNVTSRPEVATFETDFGVTFGHFVCFDILFKSPAMDIIDMNVKHILYPSMWFSQIPFLTSVQIQQAFAQRNNIVLLSAGTNSPLNSNTGSGIFVGKHGAIEKIISWKNETRMIIAEVPKDVDDDDFEPVEPSIEPYTPAEMDALNLWNFTPKSSHLLQEHFVSTVGDVTCEFSVNYTRSETANETAGFGYRLVAFSGDRTYAGIVQAGEVYCAIISCNDENDEKTCGQKLQNSVESVEFHSINVKLTIDSEDVENYLVMPSSLDTSILPLATGNYAFEMSNKQQKYEMKSTQKLENVMTFGIFGRNFALDRKEDGGDENSSQDTEIEPREENRNRSSKDTEDNEFSLKMTIYVILMVFLSIITAIMTYRKLQHPYVKPDLNKRRKSSINCIFE